MPRFEILNRRIINDMNKIVERELVLQRERVNSKCTDEHETAAYIIRSCISAWRHHHAIVDHLRDVEKAGQYRTRVRDSPQRTRRTQRGYMTLCVLRVLCGEDVA